MFADIDNRIKKIRGQIEEISYKMIEAEDEEYEDLEAQLEELEEDLDYHIEMANEMREAYEQTNRS